jgi:hypothetical protein
MAHSLSEGMQEDDTVTDISEKLAYPVDIYIYMNNLVPYDFTVSKLKEDNISVYILFTFFSSKNCT